MPICPKCRTGYDEPADICPKCGATKPRTFTPEEVLQKVKRGEGSPYRCGEFAFFCLHYARVAALFGAVGSLIGAGAMLWKGAWLLSLGYMFVISPLAYGQYVALCMAVKYACRE